MIKPMLAHKYDADKAIFPAYIQPKLDGVRCIIKYEKGFNPNLDPSYDDRDKVIAYSRTGKEFKNIEHIKTHLKEHFFNRFPDVVLDGELYNHGLQDDFEKIISLVRKTKPTDEDREEAALKVQFHVYDIITSDKGYKHQIETGENSNMLFSERNKFLRLNFGRHKVGNSFGLLKFELAYSKEDLVKFHKENLKAKYEGSIIRLNARYEQKRTCNLQKIKDFHDSEATIYGYAEGIGKREGTLGKFLMRDDDGVEFGCPPGKGYNYADLTHILENIDDYIGKRATFYYFERTKAGSYRHPLYKGLRNYE